LEGGLNENKKKKMEQKQALSVVLEESTMILLLFIQADYMKDYPRRNQLNM
jgi:hypothetical protein